MRDEAVTEAAALAERLAAALEALRAREELGRLPVEAVQRLVACAARAYRAVYAERAPEERPLPLAPDAGVTATDVAVLASGLLEAVDMDVFELQIWRSLGRA